MIAEVVVVAVAAAASYLILVAGLALELAPEVYPVAVAQRFVVDRTYLVHNCMKSIVVSSEELPQLEVEVQEALHAYTDNQDHSDKIPTCTCQYKSKDIIFKQKSNQSKNQHNLNHCIETRFLCVESL